MLSAVRCPPPIAVTPNSAARASALAAVRFQIETWAPALAQGPDAGSRRAAGTEHERAASRPGGSASAREQPGGVGVLGLDPAVGEAERVGGADLARRRGSSIGDRQRGELVRDGDVDPGEPVARQASGPGPRTARARPRSPRSSTRPPARARPGPRSASPASASARPVGRGPRGAASAVGRRAALGLQRLLIGGFGGRELLLGLDEDVLAAGARLDHEVVGVGLGRVGGRLDRRQAGVADRGRRQARVDRGCCRACPRPACSRSAARRSCWSS